MKLKLIIPAILLSTLLTLSAWADIHVTVNSSPDEITAGGRVDIDITLEGDNVTSNPPQIKFYNNNRNFTQRASRQYSQVSIINGVRNSTLTYQYTFIAASNLVPGKYKLPQAYLDLGNGNVQNLKDISVNIVREQNIQNQQKEQGDNNPNITFTQSVNTATPYLGQQIYYQAQLNASSPFMGAQLQERNFPKMWFQPLGDPKETITADGSGRTRVITIAEALYPLEAGEAVIPERAIELQIPIPRPNKTRSVFDMDDDDTFSMFSGNMFTSAFGGFSENRRFTAPSVGLNVKALPSDMPFQQKYIPVGDVKINTSLDKKEVMEGESLTFTIKLSGDANLELFNLPEPNYTKNFKIYPESPIKTNYVRGNKLIQEVSFSFAIVPTKSGEYNIPTFEILTFNPHTEAYEVLRSDNIQISVKTNPNAVASSATAQVADKITGEYTDDNVINDNSAETARTLSISNSLSVVKNKLLSIPVWVWRLVAGILVAAYLVLHIVRRIKEKRDKLKSNPALMRKSKALRTAMRALNKLFSHDEVSKLNKILLGYIGDKFMVRGESLTAKEAEELVRKHVNSSRADALAQEVKDLSNRLEQYRYGNRPDGDNASFTDVRQFKKDKQDVANIIKRIDSAGR